MKYTELKPELKAAHIVKSAINARSELVKWIYEAEHHDDGSIRAACEDAIQAFESILAANLITSKDA